MSLYEVLYDRWCRSSIGWFDPDEARLSGTDVVYDCYGKGKVHSRKTLDYTKLAKELYKQEVHLNEYLDYEEELLAILDMQIQKLWSKEIALVKALWRRKSSEEAMWESELDMQSRYTHHFSSIGLYDDF
ncbi:uncharacterized protein LOC142165162 [Nicotiana tabacum]|uniref:Uncharacterized protein LOC142165162 n=1 Tax=Nicotiana tabacum TaxID=4097 RepID=A0AC58S4H9_TOBAC